VLLGACLAALTSACEAVPESSTPGSGTTTATEPPSSAKASAHGDAAVWMLKPGQTLQGSSTKFTALVTRLDCNSGVTGQVLAPQIRFGESEIVVTFAVAPEESDPATCVANDQIAYEVDLREPLQGRALVDGRCLSGGEAATTSFCAPDSTRFKP
jgi:hypothetical protein